jgi:sialidase-1
MRAFHLRSDDDGLTWSTPQEITVAFDAFRGELDWQAIATGPGHAIEMKSGRLCVPFWMATYEKKAPRRKAIGTIFSDDGGQTWQRGGLAIPDAGEPNIAPLSDGGVLLTARNSHAESRRLVTRSADGATNWSTPIFADELLEPGCMAGIIAHPGSADLKGPLLLFSHPHTTDREHAARRDVTIHLSHDNGPSAYSDLAVLPDGTVLCFYESGTDKPKVQRKRDWAYASLTLARFNLEWLTTR